MSSGVARRQASRTTIASSQMRASVSCSGATAPMLNRSCSPVAIAWPLPWRMKAPPVAPLCSWISPACSSERSASRSVLRDTPNCSASTRSDGRRLPTPSRPAAISARICAAMSSKARGVCTALKRSADRAGAAAGWRAPSFMSRAIAAASRPGRVGMVFEHALDRGADGHRLQRVAEQVAEHAHAAGVRQFDQHHQVRPVVLQRRVRPGARPVPSCRCGRAARPPPRPDRTRGSGGTATPAPNCQVPQPAQRCTSSTAVAQALPERRRQAVRLGHRRGQARAAGRWWRWRGAGAFTACSPIRAAGC